MDDAPAIAVRLSSEDRLDHDLACLKCGYNLRSLRPADDCPECGTPVARSAHGWTLRACDPAWLERIAAGFTSLWLAAIPLGLMFVCGFLAAVLGLDRLGGFLVFYVSPVATVVAGVMAAIGIWIVTTPEKHPLRRERWLSFRRIFRYGLIAALAGTFFVVAISGLASGTFGPDRANRIIDAVLSVVGRISGWLAIAGLSALLAYIRSIAVRLPALWLARWTLLASLILAAGLVGVFLVRASYRLDRWLPWLRDYQMQLANLAIFAFGLFVLAMLVLMPCYRRRVLQAAAEARATWARPKESPAATGSPSTR